MLPSVANLVRQILKSLGQTAMKGRKVRWEAWSRYQTLVFVLAFLVATYEGSQTLLTLFTLAAPNTRCFIPSVDNHNGTSVLTSDYNSVFALDTSKHVLGKVAIDSRSEVYCTYCEPGSANVCSETNLSKTCAFGYVYDKSHYISTMTTMYNLICDRIWMRDFLKSLWMFGVLIGSVILGALSDRYGRKTTLVISLILEVALACSLPFLNSYYAVAFVQFASGMFCCGMFMSAFILVMELFEGSARTVAGIGVQTATTAGYFLNGVLAYHIRDWKQLQLTCSLPGLAFLLYLWIMPESLTWLVQTGKTAKVIELQKRIARTNGRPTSGEVAEVPMAKEEKNVRRANLLDLLRHKRLALISILTAFNWLTGAMGFFGLSWYTSDLPGNVYVNYLISVALELPAYILSAIMLEYFGRRISLSITYLLAGLCFMVTGLLRADQHVTIVAMAIAGKSCIAAGLAMAYNYAAEIFPTECRNAGTGVCSMFSRIGAIAAPQILLLGYYVAHWVPVLIFGCFALTCGVLNIFLPETKGKALPNSIEGAARLMSRKGDEKKVSDPQLERKTMATPRCVEQTAKSSCASTEL